MNWLIRIWNRWRYRPTLQNFWSPETGQKIVSMVPWRDLVVVATEYDVYVISAGHKVLWEAEVQMIARLPFKN